MDYVNFNLDPAHEGQTMTTAATAASHQIDEARAELTAISNKTTTATRASSSQNSFGQVWRAASWASCTREVRPSLL